MYSAAYFVVWTLYTYVFVPRQIWIVSVGVAVFLGLLFSLFQGRKHRRQLLPMVADVASGDYREVATSLRAGPAPADPVVLHAAARVAYYRAFVSMRQRQISVVMMAFCMAWLIIYSVMERVSIAGLLLAALVGICGAYGWVNPLLLQARSDILVQAAYQNPLPHPPAGATVPQFWHPAGCDRNL
ncbi:hypothetical protein [Mycobacteroides abscessus]|uniref:hypothetical protein n=1 Tax=Mycobacteroides abscessus TaxID=36809 RepID=UPI0012FFD549|nr:hypothetical protein [Mycobacteroides abscessus]